jgi:fructose-1,6-bisphosphatase/inositol monophosphatase family enzyme
MSDDLLPFSRALSAAPAQVTLGAPVPQADNKAGEGAFDPVTEIDRAAERALRAELEQHFPDDGIEGEEYGLTPPDAPRRWLLDPVDGTRALICGLPSWTTLVACSKRASRRTASSMRRRLANWWSGRRARPCSTASRCVPRPARALPRQIHHHRPLPVRRR